MRKFVFTTLGAAKLNLPNLAGLASESLQETEPLLPKIGSIGAGIHAKLKADVALMKSEMDRAPENPLTKQINALDKTCDAQFQEIKRMMKAGAHSTVPAKAAAGGVLMNMFEGFWQLDKEPLMTQITMTREMILRYNTHPEAGQAATTLNIADLFASLAADNNALDTLYHDRLEEEAQALPPASSMRPVVVEGYTGLSNVVVQAVNLNPDDAQLVALFHKLDAIRKKYAALSPSKIDLKHVLVEHIPHQQFAGRPVTPIPIARYEDVELVFTHDFTISYRDNDRPGEGVAILHGKGNFTGKHERGFMIE